jgi:hypothetical protein
MLDKTGIVTYSNIKTFNIKNNILIEPHMIFKKELVRELKSGRKIFKWSLNEDFWKDAVAKHKRINVVIDEAHSLANSRSSSSKINRVFGDFVALIRRVLGSNESGAGTLTLITQLPRRLDILCREMATSIMWCVCHYQKRCKHCGNIWSENNELPETLLYCPRCESNKLVKFNHIIEVWKFQNIQAYEMWNMFGRQPRNHFAHLRIEGIEGVFDYYDTLSWDTLASSIYAEMESDE